MPPSPSATTPPGVTMRAVVIACALIPLMAMWVVTSSFVWGSAYSTAISLFFHATMTVLVLALASLWARRRLPRLALGPAELMTIYAMLAVAGTLCSMDFIQVLIPMLAYPEHAATAQNRWGELVLAHLPAWSFLMDREAQVALAVGNSSLYSAQRLAAWARPLAFWGLFIVALYGALAAIDLLVRQHWTERERLAFPVLAIPLAISTRLGELLSSRLFHLGFAIAFGISALNALNFHYPSLPSIPTYRVFVFGDYLETPPWNAAALTYISINPFVIGLAFLIPVDLLFSCWFFYVFFRLQMVATAFLGLRELPRAPYAQEQAAGGYLAVGLLALWATRRHLARVARRVLGMRGGADDSGEPMPYRATAVLLLVSCGVLFASARVLGASTPVALGFFAIFFVYALAIARMRAELGPPAHDLHYMGPDTLLHTAMGTRALGEGNVATLSFFYWFNRAYRGHFSAHALEMLKAAQVQRWSGPRTLLAMAAAVAVGLPSAYWATLHALHTHGYGGRIAGTAFSSEAWTRMATWLQTPMEPDVPAIVAVLGGMLFALGLGAMRLAFTWFPLHPVGYATATSWSMDQLWFGILVAWAIKLAIVRYGGAKAYNAALPFFIGLVLGEFTTGSLLSIGSALAGAPTYCFWGN